MELTPKAQAVELIRASNKVLILTHSDPDGDAVGSALALQLTLKKLDKEADVALFGELPESLAFLPAYDAIKKELSASNDLILTIDTRQTGEDLKLGQKKDAEKHQLVIVVSPSKGTLLPDDVVVTRSRPKYDLVVILDTAATKLLGSIYVEAPELFYETPTVAIDHHPTNAYFAKVNWIDMTATSTAEMLVSLIESLGRTEVLLDADIATCLLTGILTDTNSFQNINTTPKSLTVAAQLVAAGARQQEIVEKVFRTKKLVTLKLWGKALSNLREESDHKFIWASLSEEDARSVGAENTSTNGLIDELLKTAVGMDFALLLKERDGTIRANVRSINPATDVAAIAALFGGGGHIAAAGFAVEGRLADKQDEIVATVRQHVSAKHDAPTTPIADH